MKKNVIITVMIFCSINLFGQKNNYLFKRDSIILMDSLWLKHKIWEQANVYTNPQINKDANQYPKFHFDQEEALKVNILVIPFYTLNKNILEYEYGKDFNEVISRDSLNLACFINYKNEIIAYLNAYFKYGRWLELPIVIFTDNYITKTYSPLIPSNNICDIFQISPFNTYCYSHNDSIYAFDSNLKKFTPIEEYIRKRASIEVLRDFFNRKYEIDGI